MHSTTEENGAMIIPPATADASSSTMDISRSLSPTTARLM
eukprot:CAMPEP_0206286610 /NCGR_PEP_ID=MMETSP0106_2-20121207/688_1 /ASSEMBLY_ACC=CAM_ASM_000206 /TAXON_ID=81532 /ORGANISM="Acanthoeca-like sp., Strain 10tr" /LENGTH=39 /DNA_ID= /DNA_START= /DNA_END= /DNA_ORIENTATION=